MNPAKLIIATTTLTALVVAMLLLASVMRLGFVANLIFALVLTGFKTRIGLVTVLDQVPKLLGIHIEKQGFLHDFVSVAHHVLETSLLTPTVTGRDAARADRNGNGYRVSMPGFDSLGRLQLSFGRTAGDMNQDILSPTQK